jgi:hypothetical protein
MPHLLSPVLQMRNMSVPARCTHAAPLVSCFADEQHVRDDQLRGWHRHVDYL